MRIYNERWWATGSYTTARRPPPAAERAKRQTHREVGAQSHGSSMLDSRVTVSGRLRLPNPEYSQPGAPGDRVFVVRGGGARPRDSVSGPEPAGPRTGSCMRDSNSPGPARGQPGDGPASLVALVVACLGPCRPPRGLRAPAALLTQAQAHRTSEQRHCAKAREAPREALTIRLGGEVTKDLPIINAFAATMPGRAVPRSPPCGCRAGSRWTRPVRRRAAAYRGP